MDGFAVYVHWPFCLAKCPYCDFNSHVRERIDQDRWRHALLRELSHEAEHPSTAGGPAGSIFFGGGTPSLMAPATVAALIDAVADKYGLSDEVEITLEANPTSVEAERFRDFAAAGVNRFSLGVQALNEADLAALGRVHSVGEALAAVEVARRTLDNVSLDLIYARPGQKAERWRAELGRALDFGLSHLSLYQLTIERGTQFYEARRRGDLLLPDDDLAADLFELTQELCAGAGMPAYEISNHARPGFESRHNLAYWRALPYLGLGPGAHGRSDTGEGRIALSRLRSPEKWLTAVEQQGNGTDAAETLSPEDLIAEILMMGLRTTEGVRTGRFERLTGRALADVLPPGKVAPLADAGLLVLDEKGLRATRSGRAVLNTLLAELLV